MRILVLGGDGMIGHQLFLSLQKHNEVKAVLRQSLSAYLSFGLFNSNNSFYSIDVRNIDDVDNILTEFKPDAVINAAGIVKQRNTAKEIIPCLEINALFPHRLAQLCKSINARLIQLSTDCVFSGKKGHYTEDDISDAEDIYGKTKFLGELQGEHVITLRTSSIGLELTHKTGLLEWFLAQSGEIQGFTKAIYSGLTTLEMARVIENILVNHPQLSGLWQVSGDPISKYELLTKLSKKLQRQDISIVPYDKFICDRSLISTKFRREIGYTPPSWDIMLDELAQQIKARQTRNNT